MEVLAGSQLFCGKMVTKEELLEKFQITGSENLSNEVLEKCIELCHWYDVDEEEFMDMWVAFGVGTLDGNLEPTLKALEEMKRAVPKPKQKNYNESFDKQQEQNKNFLNTSKHKAWLDEENEILGMYGASVKTTTSAKKPSSPDFESVNKTLTEESTSHDAIEPSSITTSQSQVSSFISSTQSSHLTGSKIIASLGPKVASWANEQPRKYSIRRFGPHVPADARYMFELLKTTSDVRTRVCRSIGYLINSLWAGQRDDIMITWNVRTRHQQKYRTWGRVCFESETKQSNPTVLLEGCRKPPRNYAIDAKLWPQVELDVSELSECCLFPGQIVAVEGLNLTEEVLKVTDMYKGSFISAAKPPKLTEDLKLVLAAGPFTQSNDLKYEPLWELMTRVAEEEPHVLILIGPFIDFSHPHVQNGLFNCSYQDFFNSLIEKIKKYIEGKCTQVVLVASSRDVHHHAVYPTPEYSLLKNAQSPDIHVLPDPCTLDIDGLRLGMTSIDCLMHLGREEVTLKPSGTDKLSRLGNHILNQACFYPLYPPAKEANIDSELWEKYAFLKEKPHMLFLPSDMRYFCKAINESVILNPERLSKRSFAKINFRPSSDGFWTQDNISCEIIKM